MKKINRARELHLHRVRTIKNAAEVQKRRWRRTHNLPAYLHPSHRPYVKGRVQVRGPDKLGLFAKDDYEAMMALVKELRWRTLEKGELVSLDLRTCHTVKASAVIKLHVELEVIEALCAAKKQRMVTVLWPNDGTASRLLEAVGFAGATPMQRAGHMAISSGLSGQGTRERLKTMNRCLFSDKLVMDDQPWQDLYAAISEAMLNVQHHAYKHEERTDFVEKLGPRWWLMGSTLNDQLHLVLYDKGIGIPRSLEDKQGKVKEILYRYGRKFSGQAAIGEDGGLIAAAMVYGRSRLKGKQVSPSGRGKGLSDIRHWVLQNPTGELHIYSNRGRYSYNSDTNRVRVINHDSSIHGTLIQWKMRLEAAPDHEKKSH